MDLNELFSRHQVALIAMMHHASAAGRERAEQCANHYAGRIAATRPGFTGTQSAISHQALKRILRG